ncbi:MAG: hypothetical protein KJ674_02830 [Nanoarchaeota archaeon]|nr:hypothetical protein [Nanoarchaeota archaeon]
MKIKTLLENGKGEEELSFVALEIPWIAKHRDLLRVGGSLDLTFVGLADANGNLIERDYRKVILPRSMPEYLTNYDGLRALILGDGRVFFNRSASFDDGGGELAGLRTFFHSTFYMYGPFRTRFDSLYNKFKV